MPIRTLSLLVRDSGGAPISGVLHATAFSDELCELLEADIGATWEDIQELGGTFHLPIDLGTVDLNPLSPSETYFTWLDIPGHMCSWRFAKREELAGIGAWDAVRADRLEVTLLDPAGVPMSAVEIRAFNSVDGIDYVGLPCDAKLPRKFYLRSSRTDARGVAAFTEPLAEAMTVSAAPLQGLSVPAASAVRSGDRVTLRAVKAIEVYGSLRGRDGEVIGRGYVGFLTQGERGTEDAGITAVDEDGNYVSTSVRANGGCVAAVAIADGYSPLQQLIPRPDLLDRVNLDFVMDRSVSRSLRLALPDGSPVAGARVMLSTNGYDWLPGSYTTDEDGGFLTPAYLVPGGAYVLKWWLSRWKGPDMSFDVPEDEASGIIITVPQLGRLASIDVTGRSDERTLTASFVSALTAEPLGIEWSDLSQPSPLLPAGPGYLAVTSATGLVGSVKLVVQPGAMMSVVVDAPAGTLAFALPVREDEGEWEVTLTDEVGLRRFSGMFLPGVGRIEVPVGVYCLAIRTKTPRGYSVGPFVLPATGLDLGELCLSGTSIIGRICDESGRPWSGMAIELTRDDGWYAGRVKSAADGSFTFEDLAPGYYTAVVSTNASSLLFHPDVATVVEVDSSGDQEIAFCIPVTRQSRVELQGEIKRPTTGFHMSGREVEISPIDGQDRFYVSLPEIADWIGAYHMSVGVAMLYGQRISAIEPAYLVDGAGNRAVDVRLLDAQGVPLAGTRVDLRLGGACMLPSSSATRQDGLLSCSFPPEMPLELLVHVPSGGVVPLSVSGLPTAGDVAVGADCQTVVVVCRDLSGKPISGVTVWSQDARLRRITDARGSVSLPGLAPRASLRMEMAGFWPMVVKAQPALDITLRRPVEEVLLKLPEGLPITEVSVSASFTVGWELRIDPSWNEDAGCWHIGPVPEGEYRVVALDHERTVVLENRIHVSAGGPPEVRLR